MNKIICWLKEIWRSIPQWIDGNYPISGHLFVDEEYYTGCDVTISKCEVCGKVSITWQGGKEVKDLENLIDKRIDDIKNTYNNADLEDGHIHGLKDAKQLLSNLSHNKENKNNGK